eukprot:TRINITY_DN3562_c0_g2_i3.p1 TRINITY_DN3562_c0_g2~~TRINITY_DN3562_c0_g2_i3.p1  ORF type:complete len:132 (-),score=59.56 TRINITY_DN3562_c0_g2_i3:64-459(-)
MGGLPKKKNKKLNKKELLKIKKSKQPRRKAVTLVPSNETFLKKFREKISQQKEQHDPNPTFWLKSFQTITKTTQPEKFQFSILSYNVLANAYSKITIPPRSRPEDRDWEVRAPKLIAILVELQPDIICLQG